MTAITVVAAQVKPGRINDAISLYRRAAKPVERHGGRDIRLLRAALGAENYGSLVMSVEYPSHEAWGAAYDETMADDEIVSALAEAEGANSPFTSQAVMSGFEIPLGGTSGHGPVVQTYVVRPTPGRLQENIELAVQAKDVFGRIGATGTRLFQMYLAGSQAQTLPLVVEFESMTALGRATDGLATDPAAAEFSRRGAGADVPGTLLSADVYLDIPL